MYNVIEMHAAKGRSFFVRFKPGWGTEKKREIRDEFSVEGMDLYRQQHGAQVPLSCTVVRELDISAFRC